MNSTLVGNVADALDELEGAEAGRRFRPPSPRCAHFPAACSARGVN